MVSLIIDLAMCYEKRRALRSSKKQIDGVLSRIFIHSHCKVQSHHPKGGCICHEKKKESLISITHIVQGLNIFTSQNSITENGNRLNSLYRYKAIVLCKHLVARILQRGFKLSSWLKVDKISNQIVYHQSATKFVFMLQDIKNNYKPVKLLKYLLYKHKPQTTAKDRKRIFWGRRSFIDPICCNSCMVLSMFYRLVLANFLFSLRDINLTLGLLPPEDTWYGLILWVLRVLGYFSPEFSLVVTPYRRASKRAKQLSMATIPLCFELFRCRVDVLQS